MDASKLDVARKVTVVQHECARTRIVWVLDRVYPKWLNSLVLHRSLERHWTGLGYLELIAELHYLNEKGLVRLQGPRKTLWRIQTTARGRDFIEGTVEEPGLAPPMLFG